MTLEPVFVLQSDPTANQILHSNIWSYPHCSKCTLLPTSTLSLFRPWLPNAGMCKGTTLCMLRSHGRVRVS